MFIIPNNFIKDIIKNANDLIKYKNTVTTGEITADNGDGTYDVKIANASSAFPSVATISYDVVFGVGEIVDIVFEYGCKEAPKIIGHSKKIAQEPVEVEVDYSGESGNPITKVITLNAYQKTSTTTYVEGKIELSNGAGNCIRRGFHYGETIAYGSNIYEDGSFGEGYFNRQITGLNSETTYHFQAFVLDADGDEITGEDKMFTTTTYRGYALIIAYPNTLQTFDMDGTLLKSISIAGWSYAGCGVTMDSQGNIYLEVNSNVLRKYDSNLNLLVSLNRESPSNWFEGINIGSDGYFYTLEGIASGYDVKKRSLTDLTIVATIPITTDPFNIHSAAPCLDSDGNIYIIGKNDDICKYSSTGSLLASRDVGSLNEYAGCGVLGNYVYFVKDTNEVIYLPLDLSANTTWNLPSAIAYCLTIADGYIILSGWDADGDGATAKYDSNRNLVWVKKLDPTSSYGYKAGGYNF